MNAVIEIEHGHGGRALHKDDCESGLLYVDVNSDYWLKVDGCWLRFSSKTEDGELGISALEPPVGVTFPLLPANLGTKITIRQGATQCE